ncbi:hypothetical protein C8F01DRAFT_52178 [Mycena amicta]|nr:hypothetical protein C8F01DRAFT_52178 [Mycena amicta]
MILTSPHITLNSTCSTSPKISSSMHSSPYKIKISIQNAKLEIVQYVPTRSHERAGNFAAVIESQILVLAYAWAVGAPGPPPSTGLELTGSTTFTNGIDAKEGDSTLSPRTRGILDWPTVVVEAGYSESHAQLYRDADKWMVMSQGHAFPVFLVVIVKIYNPIRIEMEFFRRAAQPNPTSPHHATQVLGLGPYAWNLTSIHPNNISSIGSIDIPLHLIYDQVPAFLTNGGQMTSLHIPAWRVQEWVGDILRRA